VDAIDFKYESGRWAKWYSDSEMEGQQASCIWPKAETGGSWLLGAWITNA